ncbi:nucleotidyltransferase domain-containing protein [Patescibacteria group bacterium]|nr:nucleotidyltransferase domain-containing protein [Candidatus Falkowbacteria bacterium]MBU3906298.1 nucleotidyltransferase domain-containing protein [Patescibacteria group bacterium]MBU4015329.1 nucleotidyltransferase domain-containing protein [Patescibacteria group bacterium]MBU4026903.1 nucleotidyltransferase domain-containing protein [Patescibacteria group bacterium]MBU4072926.1 nucleotidyltransferase domain-containing protein [Patescibacteria group bacterium]
MSKLSQKEKLALKEFKKELKKKLSNRLIKIILFGSKARGDARKDSDIDVLIIVKRKSERTMNFIFDKKIEIDCKYNVFISPKIYTADEYSYYNSIPTIFMHFISQDGVII